MRRIRAKSSAEENFSPRRCHHGLARFYATVQILETPSNPSFKIMGLVQKPGEEQEFLHLMGTLTSQTKSTSNESV
jgi:hypothetical protein